MKNQTAFNIDGVKINKTATAITDEIKELIEYYKQGKGAMPDKIALFPSQFHRIRKAALIAKGRELRSDLKESVDGRRLKPGELSAHLESNGFDELYDTNTMSFMGVLLYDKGFNYDAE